MKLNEADVIAILLDRRPEADMAKQFGVAKNTINRIRTGARWAHVAPDIQRWHRYVRASSPADVVAQRSTLDPVTGCRNWDGSLQSEGYGNFSFDGQFYLAHRVAYEAAKGPIPDGLLLRHSCDNRRCCNHEHLTPGSDQDNKDDCVSRRRHYFGEQHHWAKLTESQVQEIRASKSRNKDLAAEFGVDPSAVSHIKRNRNWRATP
ncbi:hypothetical protein R69746_05662 [Paraburkholderia aspalathi]|uniref:HNH endonuclease signature motif containing protein n=1 Tax=Paraburkholderia aspalathi TaxID=1324617 RepID=UPI00190DDA91|nr:HNH endonuclease signature motif containing protein [Paraburkholderia aspalathi]MBK3841716.1 HNH endonuclease [Paraburkholderia aspalathi]CAE6811919.1 hypothetical protein R69746_05662 [Paraburkholderia aspalathi]